MVQCRQVLEENTRAVRTGELQRKKLAEMERIHVADGVHCTALHAFSPRNTASPIASRILRARVLVQRTAFQLLVYTAT